MFANIYLPETDDIWNVKDHAGCFWLDTKKAVFQKLHWPKSELFVSEYSFVRFFFNFFVYIFCKVFAKNIFGMFQVFFAHPHITSAEGRLYFPLSHTWRFLDSISIGSWCTRVVFSRPSLPTLPSTSKRKGLYYIWATGALKKYYYFIQNMLTT